MLKMVKWYQAMNFQKKCSNLSYLFRILKKCLKLLKTKDLKTKVEKLLKSKLDILSPKILNPLKNKINLYPKN